MMNNIRSIFNEPQTQSTEPENAFSESSFACSEKQRFLEMLDKQLLDGLLININVPFDNLVEAPSGFFQRLNYRRVKYSNHIQHFDYVITDMDYTPLMAIILGDTERKTLNLVNLLTDSLKTRDVPLYHVEVGRNYWFHINRIITHLTY